MMTSLNFDHGAAPGGPGIPPTWCSSAKDIVGCAIGSARLWFTIGGGVINEVYHPRVDLPQIRDLGFIVADGQGFWVEVKRLWNYSFEVPEPGIPAARIVHRHERFNLVLRVAPGLERDVLLVEVRLEGDAALRPYLLLAPHLGGTGWNNRAAIMDHGGQRVLCAMQGPYALALVAGDASQCDALGRASAGYTGENDGWQDFARHGAMTYQYESAGPGNVAMLAELPRAAVLALAFGSSPEAAATLARTAMFEPFEHVRDRHVSEWQRWYARAKQSALAYTEGLTAECRAQGRTSAMVLRTHLDKTYPGALVASLSVPWGSTKEERPGYHLVWPRDLVECAGALLAVGMWREPGNTLRYLRATQLPDGHWHQNQWLGGTPYWTGIQLDETALPVLLAAALTERDALEGTEVSDMVRRALCYIVRNGPASDQDRWEESAGINTFTLTACIAALVAGAPVLHPDARQLALDVADYWNSRLEDWTAVCDTPLSRKHGIAGYYVRVAPTQTINDRGALDRVFAIKNLDFDPGLPAACQFGVDFLQLVRFGLRAPDDPLILGSIKLADTFLKVDTPQGPCWRRYHDDGYGEHDDGSAYDGVGRGRPWPLLTGERGHYEVACGRDPLPLLQMMARSASAGGMLPEQVWDAEPVARRGLVLGGPTGSAMPLAWTHAEYLKLVVSRALKRPFDRPEAVWRRYGGQRRRAARAVWSERSPINTLAAGSGLVLVLSAPARVHYGVNGWQRPIDLDTTPNSLGLHTLSLPTERLKPGERLDFTFRDTREDRWAGVDYHITVAAAEAARPACTDAPALASEAPTAAG